MTVQSFDGDDDDGQTPSNKLYNGVSISSVKATVESMRGATQGLGAGLSADAGSDRRITPTSRPPLHNDAFQEP